MNRVLKRQREDTRGGFAGNATGERSNPEGTGDGLTRDWRRSLRFGLRACRASETQNHTRQQTCMQESAKRTNHQGALPSDLELRSGANAALRPGPSIWGIGCSKTWEWTQKSLVSESSLPARCGAVLGSERISKALKNPLLPGASETTALGDDCV